LSDQVASGPGKEPGSSILQMDGPDEVVLDEVAGIGAVLVVTSDRVAVIRQGAYFRPRSGIRAWPHGALRDVHLEQPRNGSGSVILRIGPFPWQAVSLFVGANEWVAAERVVAQIRSLVALARRTRLRDETSDRAAHATEPPEQH
jgi:hypothetical protein